MRRLLASLLIASLIPCAGGAAFAGAPQGKGMSRWARTQVAARSLLRSAKGRVKSVAASGRRALRFALVRGDSSEIPKERWNPMVREHVLADPRFRDYDPSRIWVIGPRGQLGELKWFRVSALDRSGKQHDYYGYFDASVANPHVVSLEEGHVPGLGRRILRAVLFSP